MLRAAVLLLLAVLAATPSAAQDSAEMAQLRLYVQQLEEKVRQLTGQNEQLLYELNRLQGQSPVASAPTPDGAVAPQPFPGSGVGARTTIQPGPQADPFGGTDPLAGAAQDPGSDSIAADDPLIAADGAGGEGEPLELSTLAGGVGTAPATGVLPGTNAAPGAGNQQTAALPGNAASATSLSGSPRDEYDLAYGYVLTGDYALAEKSFQNWLANFPDDPQAADARFWLAESQLQQGEYREAANGFLGVYKAAPNGAKAPDALLKLGMSLSALGERNAACATLAEVGRKYPQAPKTLMERVDHEVEQAGC